MNSKFIQIKKIHIVFSLLFLISCNFNPFQSHNDVWDGHIYTISELFDTELAVKGETYLIEGYIFILNYEREDADFLIYPEADFDKRVHYYNLHVDVVRNIDSIFNKIENAFEETEDVWIKVNLRAKTKLITIAGNGWSDDMFILEANALRVRE